MQLLQVVFFFLQYSILTNIILYKVSSLHKIIGASLCKFTSVKMCDLLYFFSLYRAMQFAPHGQVLCDEIAVIIISVLVIKIVL